MHELIAKWENLSLEERGDLAGHTIGKMGTDIVLPAASVKVLSAGFKGAKEFSIACKTLKNAEKTLALEAFAQSSEKLEVLTSSINILENVIIHTDKLAEAGKVMDRGGLTRAGRGLMKHGYREDSFFPKPTGNVTQINAHGQEMLELILNHPEQKTITLIKKQYGPIMDIKVPNLGGARFTINGEKVIGFLEP